MNTRLSPIHHVFLCALCASAVNVFAGDLNPPAGAVAPTPGPEPRTPISAATTPGDADSLFKITQPGSYYLTGNITGVANKHGIEIVSSGVTLDLMGFDLVGVPLSLNGVGATVGIGLVNIAVVNGSIRSWGQDGVNLGGSNRYLRMEGLRSSLNGWRGLTAGFGCEVSHCVAGENGGVGIDGGGGWAMTDCSAYSNGADGINVDGVVRGCTADLNTGIGINVTGGSEVSGCSSTFNGLDGIRVHNDCVVRDNICDSNGFNGDGAGVHATGIDNRIEGNNCLDNDRGIDMDVAGNIIIRNTCSGNTTNWEIAANNVVGPILDRTAPASAAISGNSAPDSTGSTHPNANFTY